VVDRHQWTLLETEDVFQFMLGSVLEKFIHLFDSGGSLDLEDTVRQRSVGQRHAYGVTIQASAQLWEDFRNRGGRAGTGRNQTHAGSTRPTQILVRLIEDALGVGQ